MRFEIPGTPVPKGRPRFGNGHAFTDAKTRRYENLVGMCARTAGVSKIEGPVHLSVAIYLPDNRRRDGDNLLKSISDGLIGIAYADDSQVRSWQCRLELDRSRPRAVVWVEPEGPQRP